MRVWVPMLLGLVTACSLVAGASARDIRHVDQGPAWTSEVRAAFYTQDEGARLIPLAWLRALREDDGTPFLAATVRYGFLPNPATSSGLPVGFTEAPAPQGRMVGMTCSACHTRQIAVAGGIYRIDGAPAIIDFAAFVRDLDDAVGRVLVSPQAFRPFAEAALGAAASDETSRDRLEAEVRIWWVRLHTLVGRSLPTARPWGPTRLDAIAVIYNFIAGLDAGPPPAYVAPDNVLTGDAPVRYPFLWNVVHQDHTQWTGIAEFGNHDLMTARNLSEIYGVFAAFRPVKTRGALGALNRNYMLHNSTCFECFDKIDDMLAKMGAPVWPFPVDRALAARGKAIFERPAADGGCAACHGEQPGEPRPPVKDTWKTPIVDVGTDTRAWQVLLREGGTGTLEGAAIPGPVPPIKARDLSINLLKVSVAGALIDRKATSALKHPVAAFAISTFSSSSMGEPKPPPPRDRYEARVLHGIWAAAPYLHNASVPTLADLLKPADERPKSFKIGATYDIAKVGMATSQSLFDFTLHTTGCEDRNSGDSNCGHAFGTKLPDDDKKALLEYLKTL